jgi:DNA-binding NtrC family response regulator
MKNTNILIVDDRIDLVEPLGEIFKRNGYSVSIVEDGERAIWLLKRKNFDILLAPPRMSGVEVMKRLCPSMAVIIVNPVSNKKEIAEIVKSEVDAVVDKPFNMKELMHIIELVLEMPLILIVDYKVQEGEALRNMLAKRRYRALVAKNRNEVMQLVQENDFDVMLLDIGTAEVESMESLNVAKRIKPDMEVVMMVDYSSLKFVPDLIRKGARTCLYKPFLDIEKLVKVIEELQNQKRSYRPPDSESPCS